MAAKVIISAKVPLTQEVESLLSVLENETGWQRAAQKESRHKSRQKYRSARQFCLKKQFRRRSCSLAHSPLWVIALKIDFFAF